MVCSPTKPVQFDSVRPLVRYVDEEQAVIEIHIALRRPLPVIGGPGWRFGPRLEVLVKLSCSDGFSDEQCAPLRLRHGRSKVRLDVVHPRRWWPAGMGEQPLYDLSVDLLLGGQRIDRWQTTIGFTSVRPQGMPTDASGRPGPSRLLVTVNGQQCDIDAVVAIDRINENSLLPVAGDSLLLIRDHYGPDVLYEAADRAGIMLIQCVPIHPEGRPEVDVPAQVSRLAAHPSLAGWFIGHLGQVSRRIAHRLRRLDPSHCLMTDPQDPWVATPPI